MTQSITPDDDELDLRKLAQVVLTRWYWIVLATVLTAAVALGACIVEKHLTLTRLIVYVLGGSDG